MQIIHDAEGLDDTAQLTCNLIDYSARSDLTSEQFLGSLNSCLNIGRDCPESIGATHSALRMLLYLCQIEVCSSSSDMVELDCNAPTIASYNPTTLFPPMI